MTNIDAKAVASLRARTGVSMMQCKSALEEANGDEEQAIDILRKKGASAAAKKADREQTEGLVFTAEADGKAAMIRLDCETDFVARDENFKNLGQSIADALLSGGEDNAKKVSEELLPAMVQKLGENISLGEAVLKESAVAGVYVHSNGKIGVIVGLSGSTTEVARDVAMHAAAMNPLYVTPADVSEDEVNREKAIWEEQLAKEGKPAEIMTKIMEGKEKKFREDNALISQEFVKEPGTTVEKFLGDANVTAYARLAV
ncbi:MAG: translation elongation factor Ts [Candidatus Peribacter sp.]|jgi:elongation factor Ts|nr:translation elongation factor Ts [Candidatus Peribacter sp.]